MRSRSVMGWGLGLDVVAVVVCVVAPLYSGTDGSSTLLEVDGAGALVVPALFLGSGVMAWSAPRRAVRGAATTLHAVLNGLAILSIGVLFLPATLAFVVGLALELRASARPPARPTSASA